MSLMEKPQEIKAAKVRVEDELEESRMARNYDQVLVLDLWQDEAEKKFGKDLSELTDVEKSELTSPGSITRARRDLAAEDEDLRADEHIDRSRQEAAEKVRRMNKV